jgi:hypothetical protein
VFKSKADRDADKNKKVDEISIEEIIEQQRAKLGPTGGTPVTAETLAKWKADKVARKQAEEVKRMKEEAKKSGGRGISTSMSDLVLAAIVVLTLDRRLAQCCSEWPCPVHFRPDALPG